MDRRVAFGTVGARGTRVAFLVMLGLLVALFLAGCGEKGRAPQARAKATPALGRVIVLGFDGIDPGMVEKYVSEGVMPNFKHIIDDGAFGSLLSTLPPSSASAWTSAVTGVNPGKHGIYGFMGQARPNEAGQAVFNTSLQRGFQPVWHVLGEYGRRSVIINIPLTSPADSLNGLMVAGFPHATDDSSSYFWPHSLRDELSDYTFDAFRVICAKNREDRFLQKMQGIESKRLEIGMRLFDRNDWDLFWIVFTFTDRYQHYLWKYMDEKHPMYDAVGGREYGGAIRDAYAMTDRFIGDFLPKLRDNDLLIVMSDHGFGRLYYTVNGQNFLYRTIGATQDALCADFFGAKFKIDVSGPGAEERYNSVRARLIDGLRALKDPANGTPIVDSIYVKEQIYKGPYLSSAPDVVCLENPDYLFFTLPRTPDLRVIDAGPSPDKAFSGFHRRKGTVALFGKAVAGGQRFDGRIVDIAPIIMAYLGVPAPAEIDGRVPTQLFVTDAGPPLNLARSSESGYVRPNLISDQDSNTMEKQLKAVGYIQ
jgi:predicted AlkP superfamily phosphohydrolase/phosphomutase